RRLAPRPASADCDHLLSQRSRHGRPFRDVGLALRSTFFECPVGLIHSVCIEILKLAARLLALVFFRGRPTFSTIALATRRASATRAEMLRHTQTSIDPSR